GQLAGDLRQARDELGADELLGHLALRGAAELEQGDVLLGAGGLGVVDEVLALDGGAGAGPLQLGAGLLQVEVAADLLQFAADAEGLLQVLPQPGVADDRLLDLDGDDLQAQAGAGAFAGALGDGLEAVGQLVDDGLFVAEDGVDGHGGDLVLDGGLRLLAELDVDDAHGVGGVGEVELAVGGAHVVDDPLD